MPVPLGTFDWQCNKWQSIHMVLISGGEIIICFVMQFKIDRVKPKSLTPLKFKRKMCHILGFHQFIVLFKQNFNKFHQYTSLQLLYECQSKRVLDSIIKISCIFQTHNIWQGSFYTIMMKAYLKEHESMTLYCITNLCQEKLYCIIKIGIEMITPIMSQLKLFVWKIFCTFQNFQFITI